MTKNEAIQHAVGVMVVYDSREKQAQDFEIILKRLGFEVRAIDPNKENPKP